MSNVVSNVEELVEFLLEFYKDSKIPSTSTEYIANYPKGFSRQVLKSKFNLTTSDVLTAINSEYKKPERVSKESLSKIASRLGYRLINFTGNTSKTIVANLECVDCGKKHSTTYESLRISRLGCRFCKSKNISYREAPERLEPHLLRLNAELVSEIPKNQTGKVTLKHKLCGTEYTTLLVGVVSPNSAQRGTCPNCRTSDTRVAFEGTIFGSQFELDCFKLIKEYTNKIDLQVPYSTLIDTERRWTADFVINNNEIIEVSSFRPQDHPKYYTNIEEKVFELSKYPNLSINFFNSLKDLQTYLDIRYSLASSES